MKKTFLGLIILALTCCCQAQTTNAAAGGADNGTATEGTAVRVEVSNALVNTLSRSKEVSFKLQWNYLPRPADETAFVFPEKTNDHNRSKDAPKPTTATSGSFTLSNASLESDTDLKSQFTADTIRNDSNKALFLQALAGGQKVTNLKDALLVGYKFWSLPVTEALNWTDLDSATGFQWSDWLAARRDFFCIYYLFGGTANSNLTPHPFEVNLTPTLVPRGPASLTYRRDCTWSFVIVPTAAYSAKSIYADRSKHRFYRIYASVSTGQISQLFQDKDAKSISYKIKAGLTTQRDGQFYLEPATIPQADSTGDIPLDAVVPESANLTKDNTSTKSEGNLLLTTLSGGTAEGYLESLFESGEAKPFIGGLIGDGVSTTIYGLNYPLDDYDRFGFIYGIVPKANNAFYLGPSARWGIFNFSVGARIFGREDGSTGAKFAGGLSVDLSKVFTKPKPAIQPTQDTNGLGLWQSIDSQNKNNGFILIDAIAPQNQKAPPLQLVNADGKTVAVIHPMVTKDVMDPKVLSIRGGTQGLILPAGKYTIAAPEDFVIQQTSTKATSDTFAGTPPLNPKKASIPIYITVGEALAYRVAIKEKPASPAAPTPAVPAPAALGHG